MKSAHHKMTCRDVAIQLLSRRDHGEWELATKLKNKGFSAEEVEEVIRYCQHYSYLDDVRYAKSQIRQHVYKGHGEIRIRQELMQKRVGESVIEQAFDEEPQDWFELARQTALKKFKGKKALEQKEYAKQVRFLQYRGFSFEQIKYAFDDESSR